MIIILTLHVCGCRSSLTLKMTTAKVVETSVNNNKNSPSHDSTTLDNVHPQTCNNTCGFKPFTILTLLVLTKPVPVTIYFHVNGNDNTRKKIRQIFAMIDQEVFDIQHFT